MSQTTVVSYKGKQYRLLWKGKTKYGERAKLGFLSGEGEFWVDASMVGTSGSVSVSAPRKPSGRGCPECGKNRPLVFDREDGGMRCYECCDMPSSR